MYEYGKNFWHSTYERVCTELAISISKMQEIVDKYKYYYKYIKYRLMISKESERLAADS